MEDFHQKRLFGGDSTKVDLGPSRSRLDLYIDFGRDAKLLMPDGKYYTAYDSSNHTWQHLNFFQYTCFLHARVPHVKQSDSKTEVQAVSRARKKSGFTFRPPDPIYVNQHIKNSSLETKKS